jgi:hypothetical protein
MGKKTTRECSQPECAAEIPPKLKGMVGGRIDNRPIASAWLQHRKYLVEKILKKRGFVKKFPSLAHLHF